VSNDYNKLLVRRFVDEVINEGKLQILDDLLADDYTYHAPGMQIQGVQQMRGVFSMLRSGFPDWRETIDDLVAEGDTVVFRVMGSGTHLGDFMGVPPSGRRVEIMGIDIVRIADRKVAEHWAVFDQLGLLQQIGALPSGG
jgi:steroid delta-isomerase-like uncharacterized protein